jgi:cytidyltransferase-like protein
MKGDRMTEKGLIEQSGNEQNRSKCAFTHMKRFKRIGTIGRFKPLHLGGASLLEALCENAEHVIIGIGSCNPEKYGVRNPFTPQETKDMIDVYLRPRYANYEIVMIPDTGHIPEYSDGKKWKEQITAAYGALDGFVTGNPYVAQLLNDQYHLIHPTALIPRQKQVTLCATQVRAAMAHEGEKEYEWERLVPIEVAQYIKDHHLDQRFRKEFGDETPKNASDLLRTSLPGTTQTLDEERMHASGY